MNDIKRVDHLGVHSRVDSLVMLVEQREYLGDVTAKVVDYSRMYGFT